MAILISRFTPCEVGRQFEVELGENEWYLLTVAAVNMEYGRIKLAPVGDTLPLWLTIDKYNFREVVR